jgi:hypothetical protein
MTMNEGPKSQKSEPNKPWVEVEIKEMPFLWVKSFISRSVARGVSQNTTTWSQKTLVKCTYFEGGKFFRREGAGKDIDGDVCVEFSETMTRDCISWLTNIRFAKIELVEISTA